MPLPDAGSGLPESRFVVADVLLRFDHLLGVGGGARGTRPTCRSRPGTGYPDAAARRPIGDAAVPRRRARTCAGVERCKEHIRRGDAFQIVLSQRAEKRTDIGAVELYRALRRVNPSPYLFLLELDGIALVGSSPETLVKREDERASVNPIAGSTSPGAGDADRLLASARTAPSTSCSSTSGATTCRASACRAP